MPHTAISAVWTLTCHGCMCGCTDRWCQRSHAGHATAPRDAATSARCSPERNGCAHGEGKCRVCVSVCLCACICCCCYLYAHRLLCVESDAALHQDDILAVMRNAHIKTARSNGGRVHTSVLFEPVAAVRVLHSMWSALWFPHVNVCCVGWYEFYICVTVPARPDVYPPRRAAMVQHVPSWHRSSPTAEVPGRADHRRTATRLRPASSAVVAHRTPATRHDHHRCRAA